jgi:hypothetical protein
VAVRGRRKFEMGWFGRILGYVMIGQSFSLDHVLEHGDADKKK